MLDRYLCIHGHFYQPPRENPWLEAIELQDSAYPFHDWNERIADECYRQNARSRRLDDEGRIIEIVNNYSKISFNFGPTLLSWLENHEPDVYNALLEADKRSMERFGGHGSAMAQAYGHMILPLSNDRDRRTQINWGVRDFERRFGRRPEGMWLPETAVNIPTLEALAEEGVRFTLLAPRQAKRIRPLKGGKWTDVEGEIDPSRAYEAKLPSGRSIALFFYDGPISQAVAFEGLLNSGKVFAERLRSGFHDARDWPQLVHIATDGETYGHHHRHGDMALASALEHIDRDESVRLINYAEFLDAHPPTHEVEIVEDSSWSCVHGVERWRSDCGCHSGMHSHWNQRWRAPLRDSLDWLRDSLIPKFEKAAEEYFKDAWQARADYIDIVLDRTDETIDAFFADHASRTLDERERIRALKLLELQRHAMLMYTSCGWFFDDISGIETVQVIQYAGRAIQLAHELFEENLEDEFLARLERAPSNVPQHGNGRNIYQRFVKPAFVDLTKVGAHFALSSLFEEYEEQTRVYCYDVEVEDERRDRAGKAQLVIGRSRMRSHITQESSRLSYLVLYLGEHIMNCAVREHRNLEEYENVAGRAAEAFRRADFSQILRLLDEFGDGLTFSLASLFRDEQRKVTRQILESTLEEIEETHRRIYEAHAPLMRFLSGLGIPAPAALEMPAEFIMNARIRESLNADPLDPDNLRELVKDAREQSVRFDQATLSFAAEHCAGRLATSVREDPADAERLEQTRHIIAVLNDLPFEVDLSDLQNAYYVVMRDHRPGVADAAKSGDESARHWLSVFDELGGLLNVRVPTA